MKKTLATLLLLSFITTFAQEPIPYRKDSLWGFCNKKKEVIIPCEFTKVKRFYEGSEAIVWKGELCGLIGQDGKLITELQYHHLRKYDDFYFAKKDKLWGIIDPNGKTILETKFEDVSRINDRFYTSRIEILTDTVNKNDNFIIQNNNVYFVHKGDTTLVYYEVPEELLESDDEFVFIGKTYEEDSLGNVFINGNFLQKPEFFEKVYDIYSPKGVIIGNGKKPAKYRLGNNILAYKSYKWGFKDSLNQIIISPKYDNTYGFSDHLAAVQQNNYWGFINKYDSIIIPIKYKSVKNFYNGITWVKNDTAWALINKNNKLITPFIYERVSYFKEGLAYVKKGGKWGYVDQEGNVKIDFIFTQCEEFSEKLAQVCTSDSTCGYINKKGKVKIPLVYGFNYGGQFREGLAEVQKQNQGDRLYGFINKKGKIIVPLEYETCFDYNQFYNGLGMLQFPNNEYNIEYKKLFYFDKKGRLFFD